VSEGISTEASTDPVKGRVVTTVELSQPRRKYIVRTETTDGKPAYFTAVSNDLAEGRHRSETMRVAHDDLRALAAALHAHADELETARQRV